MCVSTCERACVCACVRACVHMCERACVIYLATPLRIRYAWRFSVQWAAGDLIHVVTAAVVFHDIPNGRLQRLTRKRHTFFFFLHSILCALVATLMLCFFFFFLIKTTTTKRYRPPFDQLKCKTPPPDDFLD